MDKIKKFLAIPLCYHIGLFVAFAIFNGSASSMMLITVDLLLGLVVTPVFFAVLSIMHAIVHEGKVYDYIYNCLAYLAVIGVLRVILYFVFNGGSIGILLALAALVVSVGVFTLWDCIFALTDRMMKKRPGKRRK